MFLQLQKWFSELPASARTGLGVGALFIIILFCALLYWTLRPNYQILFANLEPQDGQAMIAELDRLKVPYRLIDDGKTILVPEEQVYKTRLQLLGKGVSLKGTVGFEIFNESDFGMTDFAQKINYQRALQGEIERTIMGLEEVQSARVHLVMPETGLLKKEGNTAKASVSVATKSGNAISAEQVLGIQRLVAAAIPEIEASSVTVLDNRGVVLSKNTGKNLEANTEDVQNRMALKQQTEKYFSTKIANILDKAFLPGQTMVSVDVTLDYDSVKITREDVVPVQTGGDPNGILSRSKTDTQRTSRTIKTTSANSLEGNASPEINEHSVQEKEYQHGKKIEQMIRAPGSIKRLSVGVILPDNVDSQQLEMYSKIIAMAVGLNAERGDAIAVYPLHQYLDQSAQKTAPVSNAQNAQVNTKNQAKPNKLVSANADSAQSWLNIALLALIAILALCSIIYAGISLFAKKQQRLSEQQRADLLNELQTWLSSTSIMPSQK